MRCMEVIDRSVTLGQLREERESISRFKNISENLKSNSKMHREPVGGGQTWSVVLQAVPELKISISGSVKSFSFFQISQDSLQNPH